MNAMPTAAAAGKIDVGGDVRVLDLGRSARSTRANPLAALSR
jgi:hypothetical protein